MKKIAKTTKTATLSASESNYSSHPSITITLLDTTDTMRFGLGYDNASESGDTSFHWLLA
jgi:hypothetical protein